MPLQFTKHSFPHKWSKQDKDHPYFRVRERDQDQDHHTASKVIGKLIRQAKLLLAVHGLFAVANALSGTFVNVYLWKVSNDFVLIGWFSLAHQIANALTFFAA